jgi:class 3 adenylate cyclase
MAEQPDNPIAPALVRKLATILSADVAGYSRLMAEDEEQTLLTFRAHSAVFEALVAEHRGRIFNRAGDAILAEFDSAVESVRCATDIQAALQTRNGQLPEGRRVRFRIGVNLGDVLVQGEDLLGDGVNVAARIQTAAEPGGICLSGSVYDQIRNKLSLSFKPLGEMSFKNIPQPVRTFSITGTESDVALPAPESTRRGRAGAVAAIVATVLLLVAGGGYWALSQNRPDAAAPAAVPEQAEPKQPERAVLSAVKAPEAAPKPLVEPAPPPAPTAAPADARSPVAAGSKPPETASPPAANAAPADARPPEAAGPITAAPAEQKPPAPATAAAPPRRAVAPVPPRVATAPPAAPNAALDGLYAGPVCYGPSPNDPARCFRAQATLERGRITGQWPGREPGMTVFLSGVVSTAGDAQIEMRGEKSDGTRLFMIDLLGRLESGRLAATGSFRNGRSASLDWHHNN